MSFVVDNSVALAWCFEDEHIQPIMDLLDRVAETGAIAPSLWPLEALNGLLMAERRRRLDPKRRQRLAGFLRGLPVTLDAETADRHGPPPPGSLNATGSPCTTLPIWNSRSAGNCRSPPSTRTSSEPEKLWA